MFKLEREENSQPDHFHKILWLIGIDDGKIMHYFKTYKIVKLNLTKSCKFLTL